MVSTSKVEAAEVGTRVDVATAHVHKFAATADYFVNRLFGVNVFVLLVNVGQLNRFTHFERTCIGLIKSHNKAEERSLTHTIRTDYADNACRGKREVEVFVKHLITKGF